MKGIRERDSAFVICKRLSEGWTILNGHMGQAQHMSKHDDDHWTLQAVICSHYPFELDNYCLADRKRLARIYQALCKWALAFRFEVGAIVNVIARENVGIQSYHGLMRSPIFKSAGTDGRLLFIMP